jgi:hypothetical protein
MALCPAQVHAQEHLGPVGGLGAARAGADRNDRAALVVRAREEQPGTRLLVFLGQRGVLGLQAGDELGVVGSAGQLGQLAQVVGARDELVPEGDLLAQALGGPQDVLRPALGGPEVGRARLLVELAQPLLLVR